MSLPSFLPKNPLSQCSRAFHKAAAKPRHMGTLTSCEGMRLVSGEAGSVDEQNLLTIVLLVDEEDGVIADARFQAFAHPALIALSEITCDSLLRKTYDQARRISSEYIEALLKNFSMELPAEFFRFLNYVLDAVLAAATQCMDIPLQAEIAASPVEFTLTDEKGIPGFEALSNEQKIAVIKQVIDKDVRPYIELDAGGIEIVELKNGIELLIAYQGACTTCPSSIGGTLDAITRILRAKVYPHLIVTPDASFLRLGGT